jgi:hypothetical protein
MDCNQACRLELNVTSTKEEKHPAAIINPLFKPELGLPLMGGFELG